MLKSLIVRACVNVVHNGEWSMLVWRNKRRRLFSCCRSCKHSALPFSMKRCFFLGQCAILLSVLLLFSVLRCPMLLLYFILSKLFDRIMAPFLRLLRRFVRFNDGSGWADISWIWLIKRVDGTKGESFLLIDAWSSMPFILMV